MGTILMYLTENNNTVQLFSFCFFVFFRSGSKLGLNVKTSFPANC